MVDPAYIMSSGDTFASKTRTETLLSASRAGGNIPGLQL